MSYILSAPAFVTQPFRDLFADGLPPHDATGRQERGAARRSLRLKRLLADQELESDALHRSPPETGEPVAGARGGAHAAGRS